MKISRPGVAVLGLAVGMVACGGTRGPSFSPALLLSNAPPPPGRVCQILTQPEPLPPAGLVVDSAALAGDIAALRRAQRFGAGYALFSIEYDQNGYNIRRAVIEHDLPREVADTLQKLVFARHLQTSPGDEWGVRLRIDIDDGAGMRVGRQLYCEPRMRDFFGDVVLSPGPGWDIRQRAPTQPAPTVRTRVEALIDERGAVVDARILGATLDRRREEELAAALRAINFEPALRDGIPVRGWITLAFQQPSR